MNKELFNKEISEIDIPRFEVFSAINKGIEKGRKEKSSKRKSKSYMFGAFSAAAASVFLASGFIFAPMTNVFAAMPLIGSIYEKYSLQIGNTLQQNNLVTKLNKKATSNGIDITLTSAYYDGNVIGVTFKAQGNKLSLERSGLEGPESGYDFHLFNGNEKEQWPASMTSLVKTNDGYIASMEFYNPEANLPKTFKLPLTFTAITGVEGSWKFDVPVEQLPINTIPFQAESSFKSGGYSLKMESVIEGKATTLLKYKTTFPLNAKDDEIEITVIDNEGNRLSKSHSDLLSSEQNNVVFEKNIRELFTSKLNSNAEYLTVQPVIRRNEKDTIISLENGTPTIIESRRFPYKMIVNKIKQSGNKLFVDYYLESINTMAIRKDIIQNFAESINLIKSNEISKDKNGNLDIEQMQKNKLSNNKVKVIDDGTLHFQSTFIVDGPEEFDYKDCSMVIPFGTLSLNDPIKMDPIKMELNN